MCIRDSVYSSSFSLLLPRSRLWLTRIRYHRRFGFWFRHRIDIQLIYIATTLRNGIEQLMAEGFAYVVAYFIIRWLLKWFCDTWGSVNPGRGRIKTNLLYGRRNYVVTGYLTVGIDTDLGQTSVYFIATVLIEMQLCCVINIGTGVLDKTAFLVTTDIR